MNIELLRDMVLWVEKEAARPVEDRNWSQGLWASFAAAEDDGEIYDNASGEYVQFSDEALSNISDYNACGALYCVAGKIVIDAGLTRIVPSDEYKVEIEIDSERVRDLFPSTREKSWLSKDWQTVASHILEVEPSETEALFSGDNTAKDVRKAAENLAKAHGEIL